MSNFLKLLNGKAVATAIVSGDLPATIAANTTGTASNITATSNSSLTTLSSLSLPGSQVTGNISGNAANVTGTVATLNGGTGNAFSPTQWGVIYASSTSAMASTAAGSAGQVLTSNGTSAPTFQALGTGSYIAPTVSLAYSSGIGTGGFTVSPSTYGYVFTITSASAVAGDIYQSSATVTISNASPGVITSLVAHNLQVGMPVVFATTGALPSPLVAGTTYYVSGVASATTFQVAAFPNGVALSTTTAGSGTQTLTYGSYKVSANTSSSPSLVTTTPTLANCSINSLPAFSENLAASVVPIAPPVSGTLARVSGSGPTTLTFTNGQFYNTSYTGTYFITTSANATAGAVYQDQKTVTITIAAPAVGTTSVAHGLIVGQPVSFSTTGALPTGITAATTYFVSAVPSATTFQISTTSGGSSLTTTGTQSGTQTLNMASYTVATGATITGFTSLFTTQSSGYQPGISGTLSKISGTGDSTISYSSAEPLATYTVPTSPRSPLYIEIEMAGAGGGGTGSGEGSPAAAGSGGATAFGTALIVCGGGSGSPAFTAGGAGGLVTANSGPIYWTTTNGPAGNLGGNPVESSSDTYPGGLGGITPLGGASSNIGPDNTSALAAQPNTGSGGSGSSFSAAGATLVAGSGGGAGAYVKALISSLSSTYLYAVGTGGIGGPAAASGFAGGQGGSGVVKIKELYQ
jgi:hypothetical protein